MATRKNTVKLLPPAEIKAYLDQYVIGQEEAKKILSVAVYNHFKKIIHNSSNQGETEMDKSNILLLGETGSGKTLLVKTIARLLNVPCYIQDCTKITASGYVGSDVEDCLAGLLRTCGYNTQKAEMGIVVLDEVDKIAKAAAGPSITRDVSGECVQQSLLKIVEGDLVGVPPAGGRKHPEQSLIYVNTKNILFIATGAFVGIDAIIRRRVEHGQARVGFTAVKQESIRNGALKDYLSAEDIRSFGFIPEFIGRFPILTSVAKLEKNDLKRILLEPRNSIVRQYIELLDMDNTDLVFNDGALDEIAVIAYRLGTGARALRSIVELVMTDIMFNAPSNLKKKARVQITITRDMVKEKAQKKYRIAI